MESDNRLTPLRESAIRRLDAERTPGEWHWVSDELMNADESLIILGLEQPQWGEKSELVINAGHREYLALCSWAIPALLDEIDRLRAERTEE